MGSHSVTCHPTEVRILPLPIAEAGTRFSDPGGMQGWVDLYVTWKRTGWKLNRRPVNCKSNALPLSHHATMCWTDLHQTFRITDKRPLDNRRKLAYSPSFCALAFQNGWQNCNVDARFNTADDPSTSIKTPEFCRRVCAGRAARSALRIFV